MNINRYTIFLVICYIILSTSFKLYRNSRLFNSELIQLKESYFDDVSLLKSADKKSIIGFTTDFWNVGQKKYKNFLPINHMIKRIQKLNYPCVEIPLWEIQQGPHYEELQKLFESFWIPDMTASPDEQFLLKYDLVILSDQVMVKYLVESYYEKEAKLEKKKLYYKKLMKQPWGVIDSYPPKEKYDYERIKSLSKQRWIPKFPPLATVGEDVCRTMRHFGPVQYSSRGIEDFSLFLPDELIPTKRVLVLRYKNKFDTLIESLTLRGIDATSAYPVTWGIKEWSPQEDRLARDIESKLFILQ